VLKKSFHSQQSSLKPFQQIRRHDLHLLLYKASYAAETVMFVIEVSHGQSEPLYLTVIIRSIDNQLLSNQCSFRR
jgi:hypothetical protein